MYGRLRAPTREKKFSGSTLSPAELLSQSNVNYADEEVEPSPYNMYNYDVPLEEALNASYGVNDLSQYGYLNDPFLSNKENRVFYNPAENKVITTVAGTNMLSPRDIGTDLYLAFMGQSGLKMTDRYKEAESVIKNVRKKYPKAKRSLVGHSLGSAIINTAAEAGENVKGFATGSGLFPSKNVGTSFRTFYDPLSYTSSDTIIEEYKPKKKGNLRGKQKVDYPQGVFPSHSYQNLRNKNIYV